MNQKLAYSSQHLGAVPRPVPYRVGQRDSTLESGTTFGTARDSFSLKGLIQAKKCYPNVRDNVGQDRDSTQKMLSQRPEGVGQQKLAYFSRCPGTVPLTPDGVPNYAKHETGQTHPIDLVPLPVEWTPDKWDGRPCCFLPHTPERLRGVIPSDLRGMRIPSNGLPPFLRGISACGWTLELLGGELHLKQAHPAARNEAGCLGYMRIHAKSVAADWRLWREMVEV